VRNMITPAGPGQPSDECVESAGNGRFTQRRGLSGSASLSRSRRSRHRREHLRVDMARRRAAKAAERQIQAARAVAAMHLLHLPSPLRRRSGLPSPVLKFAWQRRQTDIREFDIIGLTPRSGAGRAAVYSACDWRSLWEPSVGGGGAERRVAMAMGWDVRVESVPANGPAKPRLSSHYEPGARHGPCGVFKCRPRRVTAG
jgi:hypothetical protein